LAALCAGTALAGQTPAQTCESGKNKAAGAYAICRQQADAKYAITGDGAARTAALQRCADKFATKWAGLEARAIAAGGSCPSVGEQAAIQGFIDTQTAAVAAACAGTGQDGELQKGLARAYVDNGDGTITDTTTGLMWEKLSDDGSMHDKDDTFAWPGAFGEITALNGGGGFAGFTDWRLPNINELVTLSVYGALFPSIAPALDTACAPGCTVLTCSCTTQFAYWSSSTYELFPNLAWGVNTTDSYVNTFDKTFNQYYVRAVRGGS